MGLRKAFEQQNEDWNIFPLSWPKEHKEQNNKWGGKVLYLNTYMCPISSYFGKKNKTLQNIISESSYASPLFLNAKFLDCSFQK